MFKRKKEKIHFIGIGGIGMSGIADILFHLGFPISGSDLSESDTVKRLRGFGIDVYIGHNETNLKDAKVVVYSSAVKDSNPEIVAAKKIGLPIVSRAEMLAELMRLKYGVGVAGTHGKTTTTSMLGTILAKANLDPTVIVGGKVDAFGGNAKLGQGKFIIAEADESDGTFLKLSPVITIITNIDNDHLDYFKDMNSLRSAFLQYANKVPYYGRSILCLDDPGVQMIIPMINRPFTTYGFIDGSDYRIQNFIQNGLQSNFNIIRNGIQLCSIQLNVPGTHNALNATAAIIAALEMDLELDEIRSAIATFQGAKRRFEKKGEYKGVTIIDDYGHHPTEIYATLTAARRFWKGRIVVAFQPHRFSRTQICWNEFGPCLKIADEVFLLDIYAAGEPAISDINSSKLATENNFHYAGSLDHSVDLLKSFLKNGDLLITLGAGNITQLAQKLIDTWK